MVSLTASSSSINESRFEELWNEHLISIRRYVLSLRPEISSVDDILQETAISLWRKFDAYDPARPFVAWACRFALLQTLKQRQQRKRDRLAFHNDILNDELNESHHESELTIARREALAKSLPSLADSDRRLLHRRYHSTETVQCMAKQESISVYKLYHSLDAIRESLKMTIDQRMMNEGWERIELV